MCALKKRMLLQGRMYGEPGGCRAAHTMHQGAKCLPCSCLHGPAALPSAGHVSPPPCAQCSHATCASPATCLAITKSRWVAAAVATCVQQHAAACTSGRSSVALSAIAPSTSWSRFALRPPQVHLCPWLCTTNRVGWRGAGHPLARGGRRAQEEECGLSKQHRAHDAVWQARVLHILPGSLRRVPVGCRAQRSRADTAAKGRGRGNAWPWVYDSGVQQAGVDSTDLAGPGWGDRMAGRPPGW